MKTRNISHSVPSLLVLCCFIAFLPSKALAGSPSFTISPGSIAFNNVNVGMETAVTEITITNTGTTSMNVTAFSITPFNTFILEYGWTRTLQKGMAGIWAVRFRPQAAGAVTGQISFTISGVAQPQIVTLSGTGTTTGAVASINPNVVSFPATAIGSTASQTVTVTNTGKNAFKISAITVLPPFNQTGYTSLVTIQPKKSFSFQVTFTPGQVQSYANAISLTYDIIPAQTISVAGSGTAPPGLAVSSFPVLPMGAHGFAYLANFMAAGGTPPYTWSLASGAFPTGLTLSSSTGALTGPMNAAVGNYNFTIQAADSSTPQLTATSAVTLPVATAASACNNITWDQTGTTNPEVDLPDLGTGSYMGTEGGLYPGGSNVRPADHEADGLALAGSIVPLDSNGNPSPTGKYVLLSIGVSISRTMFTQFQLTEQVDPTLNPNLVIVDGAIDGTNSPNYANFKDGSWQTILNFYLPYQNVTADQVVAVWLNDPHSQPKGTYPGDMAQQESDVISALQNMQIYFPNLKLAYIESMHYGGYATNSPTEILPEPYAYETGFATQDVIADQINGQANLNYNPNNGPVVAPWLSWGTYDWANGMLPNGNALPVTSGLEWSCADLGPDGVHASTVGKYKDAALLTTFMKTDETVTPWYLAPSPK
jgi:Putative Ig domain/Abnormal spindle-like microcephaly-assoc'd, ASPM-SPD-2-Hydin